MNEPSQPRERAVAFVVARLGSSRLAAKHLRTIGDRSMLDWVIDRLRASSEVDEIVITTVASKENEPLREYAAERGVGCYWYEGDVEHVTTRLRTAAEAFDAEICILISADSPLLHTPGVDLLISELRSVPSADIVGGHPQPEERPPSLLSGVVVARRACWQLADDLSDTPELRRHQFPIIRRREELFRVHNFALPEWYYRTGPRVSVDTWADLEFMNAVHARLGAIGEEFNLAAVVKLCEREPQWAELNQHVHQRRTEELLQEVLFVVDARGRDGAERLLRSRELALQVVETKGWPVGFLVDQPEAKRRVEECGLTAHLGSLRGSVAENGAPGVDALELSRKFDLVVLDLAPERELANGWREQLAPRGLVAVLDSRQPWTNEAELRVGLPEHALLGRKTKRLLRETARFGRRLPTKTNDLVTDLVEPERRAALRRFAERNRLTLIELEREHPDFERELARSRVYLGRPGTTALDARALGTVPIAWTGAEHDAENESALSVRRESDLFVLHAALARSPELEPGLVDGAEALIARLEEYAGARATEQAA